MEYKSNNHIVYSCHYYVVWCPKYRRKVLTGKIETRLKEIVTSTCVELNIDIIEMEIMPDHVRLLINVEPQYGVHKAIKTIKRRSSSILRKEFKELTTKLPTLWTNSYFISTDEKTPLSVIQTYIENQKTSERKKISKQK